MINDKSQSGYGSHIHRVKALHTVAAVFTAFILLAICLLLAAGLISRQSGERKYLLDAWNSGDFEAAFNISQAALPAKPMNYFLLTIHGFSAYQLGISQINNFDTLRYMDECVLSLRKALLLKESEKDGRVYYVLGKAYCNKGDDYADLAVKYLERAQDLSFSAADIPEYLGIAYASIGDYRNSVRAFSQALSSLNAKPSGMLLLSIARSYAALNEAEAARAYLVRCLELSRDSKTAVTARLFLAEIYDKLGDGREAENQYLTVLETAGENAEAHYQLGELYSRWGETARARSEWRLALRADPAHQKARARLN
jgi:tetratricopeptide (TPR) repeat protein